MRRRLLKIDTGRTCIMGVLNVTPDSFYDKGKFFNKDEAVKHAVDMVREGAGIIDIGGESTRPGAEVVPVAKELDRIIPVIRAISKKTLVPISIDTRKAVVAEEALKCGASIVNDISALRFDPEMASVIAGYGATCVLMHMKGSPKDMQDAPVYGNVIKEIISFFKEAIRKAKRSGIADDKIIIDPGIGFGKTLEHNIEILRRLDEFKALGYPICVGTSRKSFIGKILSSDDPEDRLAGTLATCAIAIIKGAKVLRVHDVNEAVQVAAVTDRIIEKRKN
jgi:dihydropteroate synthase